ncbi:uncharacterized protein MONOS_8911 [Monocercomonoides exilis]|uniref:uncharacterized protein n=1 Tax=Monocercomonoides exilis TaxID=2049356 RepID=UPI00355A53BF|nr:hypothetical protein MONOS_8911 [Monocercomonoides exilis]|eukprot:MONOS_8911.1-p1 / transcript=MONOS_8911.1 / gene=MONOS_8911 / organism=Monocercomonoides_exilis_PA203 / gene_product=unspecified product / transcript_product=unspecified product / location=Mono_scaffold00350:41189-41404(+) / protein_length=72 / sequence_SO=supercontig / SO=protein_coding / is_pseudo=false
MPSGSSCSIETSLVLASPDATALLSISKLLQTEGIMWGSAEFNEMHGSLIAPHWRVSEALSTEEDANIVSL